MDTSRPSNWFQIFLIVFTLAAHLYVALAPEASLMMWYRIDDAFFYFTTARNIAQGFGPTFDQLGLTNGFHPLWMLVCVPVFALARVNLVLPLRVLTMVMAIFDLGTGLLLYRMLLRFMTPAISMLLAVFWMFIPPIHSLTSQSGLEMGINAFCLVWLLYLISALDPGRPATRRELALVGLAAALSLLSRLDNAFVLVLIGLWVTFRSSPLRYQLMWYALLTALSAILAFMFRIEIRAIPDSAASVFTFLVIALSVKIVVYYLWGLPLQFGKWTVGSRLLRLGTAVSLASAIVAAFVFGLTIIGRLPGFPRSVLLIDWALSLLLIGAVSFLCLWLGGDLPQDGPVAYARTNWRGWLRAGGIYFGIVGATLAAYMLWSFLAVGTPVPVSGMVKEWWGTMNTVYGHRAKTADSFLGLNPTDEGAPFELSAKLLTGSDAPKTPAFTASAVIILILAAVLFAQRRLGALAMADRLALLPLLVGGFIQVWSYNIRSYIALGEWYWIAQMLFTVLFLGVLLESLVRLLPAKIYNGWTGLSVAGLLAFAILAGFIRMMTGLVPLDPSQVDNPLTRNIAFLRENTEPGDVIGLTGGGYISYFLTDRTVINLDGLINSYEYYQRLRKFNTAPYLDKVKLKYVFGNPYIIQQSDPYQEIFAFRLTEIKAFGSLALFRFHSPTP